jgi:hypothetical protein
MRSRKDPRQKTNESDVEGKLGRCFRTMTISSAEANLVDIDYFHYGGDVDNVLRDCATLQVEFTCLLDACGPSLPEFVKIENQNKEWVFTKCSKNQSKHHCIVGFSPMRRGECIDPESLIRDSRLVPCEGHSKIRSRITECPIDLRIDYLLR